jgi:CheY-like chemotaxis protein
MIDALRNGHEPVNILLVDDQPSKLLSYEAMLGQLGENLVKANSAKEALDHLLRKEITVVLMDVSMPDIDGFELAQHRLVAEQLRGLVIDQLRRASIIGAAKASGRTAVARC